MPINAGEKITAANTAWDIGGVALTDLTAGVLVDTYQPWGGEQIQFPNPGVPVKVSGQLSGRVFNLTDADQNGMGRVLISLDGGATFTSGNEPFVGTGSNAGGRGGFASSHFVRSSGAPTGDIVIKAEARGSSVNNDYRDGFLIAYMLPQ
ncbi:hypothetical protein [Prauserella flavalba]|uniref:hypothetical protein n=1 Tax=Prauserella flavalba TaxID=1477506 RepID=UPI0036F17B58